MGLSSAKMMNTNKNPNEKDTVLYVSASNKIRNHTENENIVILYHNKDVLAYVNKQKLLEKSAFFRAILKTCYKDHKYDLMKVSIPVSCEVIKKVMKFINTGRITLDMKTLLETCHLAIYLQIDSLSQLCLDHFTTNLNQNTLESQLQIMSKHSYLDEKFRERAEMFTDSKSPSFSGLYFLQADGAAAGKSLRMFSKQFKSVNELSQLTETRFSSLHHCNDVLCSIVLPKCLYFNMTFYQEKQVCLKLKTMPYLMH